MKRIAFAVVLLTLASCNGHRSPTDPIDVTVPNIAGQWHGLVYAPYLDDCETQPINPVFAQNNDGFVTTFTSECGSETIEGSLTGRKIQGAVVVSRFERSYRGKITGIVSGSRMELTTSDLRSDAGDLVIGHRIVLVRYP